jgi:hypothetical protein
MLELCIGLGYWSLPAVVFVPARSNGLVRSADCERCGSEPEIRRDAAVAVEKLGCVPRDFLDGRILIQGGAHRFLGVGRVLVAVPMRQE